MHSLTPTRRPMAWRPNLKLPSTASIRARVDDILIPDAPGVSEELGEQARRTRSLRIVGFYAGASVVSFVPSLVVAGVPTDRWLPYIASVVATVIVISWSLLLVPRGSGLVPIAVVAAALAIAGLGWMLREHFHQLALLYALVIVGVTAIHGLGPALLMVLCGALLVPITITAGPRFNPTDVVYAFLYLCGVAMVPWIHIRLRDRGLEALRASAAKYRALVEHVPAIVYTATSDVEGACEYVSPRVQELLGFPAAAWTDEPGFWVDRVHPDDRQRMVEHWRAEPGREAARSRAVEYRMIDHRGQVRWVRDEAAMFETDDGPSLRWTGFLTDITERKALEEQLQHQAFHDPLTGLPNRALFADRVGHALARAGRRPGPLAVLFLDLDDFKTVNDGIGHEAGDELLVAVGAILRACLRPMDTAARLGGDEFAILLEDLPEAAAAQAAADRILAALASPIVVQGREIVISASIGIATPASARDSVADIMRNADGAMYAAKRHGKGRHETFAPVMREAVVRRLELAGEMRKALEQSQFAVYYQPIVRLADGVVSGFEALVRWHHPRRGLVLPGEFISAAEETGQIIDIGRFVLEEACRQARAWQDAASGACPPMMSVNVSARQFRDPGLCESVTTALTKAGLEASSLTLEITESTIMEDSDAALQRLDELKALGVHLAIDDFGTGYSSLSYLRRLPVDVLKLDKSFVDGIDGGGQALALARVIVSIGQTLGLDTVAEGVELASQATALARMGCEVAQGFHFARPLAADDVATVLTTQRVALPSAPDSAVSAQAPTRAQLAGRAASA